MTKAPYSEVGDKMDDRRMFYPVWIADGRQEPISWGRACNTAGEALRLLRERLAAGTASMGVVVRFADGKQHALESYILPRSARTSIRHYLDILDMLEHGKPP
jgi:hypothetical protein